MYLGSDANAKVEGKIATKLEVYDTALGEGGRPCRAILIEKLRRLYDLREVRDLVLVVWRKVVVWLLYGSLLLGVPLLVVTRWTGVHLGLSWRSALMVAAYELGWFLGIFIFVTGLLLLAAGIRRRLGQIPGPTLWGISGLVPLLLVGLLMWPASRYLSPSAEIVGKAIGVALILVFASTLVSFLFFSATKRVFQSIELFRHSDALVIEGLIRCHDLLHRRTGTDYADVLVWLRNQDVTAAEDSVLFRHEFTVRHKASQEVRQADVVLTRRTLSLVHENTTVLSKKIAEPSFYLDVQTGFVRNRIRFDGWSIFRTGSSEPFFRLIKAVRQVQAGTLLPWDGVSGWHDLKTRTEVLAEIESLAIALERVPSSTSRDGLTAAWFQQRAQMRAKAVRNWKHAVLNPMADSHEWLVGRLRGALQASVSGNWDAFETAPLTPRSARQWVDTVKGHLTTLVIASTPFVALAILRKVNPEALKDSYLPAAAVVWAIGAVLTRLDPHVSERMKDFSAAFPFSKPGAKS